MSPFICSCGKCGVPKTKNTHTQTEPVEPEWYYTVFKSIEQYIYR